MCMKVTFAGVLGDWKSPLLFARKATEEFDCAKKKSSSSSHTKILENRRLFAKKVVPLQPNSINIMSNSLT